MKVLVCAHNDLYILLCNLCLFCPFRLELKGNNLVLGEFLEFKGKKEDMQTLREIKRSKVSCIVIQKMRTIVFGNIQIHYRLHAYTTQYEYALHVLVVSILKSVNKDKFMILRLSVDLIFKVILFLA